MRKLTLLIVMISLLVLAACSGAAPTQAPAQEQPTQAPAAEQPTEEAAMPEEEISLTLAAGAVGQELELSKAAAQRFMDENPNITVEVLETPDMVQDRLGLYLQFLGAQSPDIDVYQIDVIWPGILAEHAIDLGQYISQDVLDQHFEAIVENNTVGGKLVAIPWFTDAGLLYYRTDLLEKYGYDGPPETWAELEEMATTIQEGERSEGMSDFWGFVWQGNAYEGLTCDALEWQTSYGGGKILDAEGNPQVNNPETIEAITQAAGWVGTISPPGVTTYAEEDARAIWQTGNAAFMRNWPYAYSLGQGEDSAIKDKFDVTPLPSGGAGSAATLGGWQLMVSQYSEHPEAAAALAAFLASPEEQKIRAIEGSLNPTVKSLYEDEDVLAATPFFGSLYDVFINAVARPSTVSGDRYNQVSEAYFTAVHDIITGDADAAARLEQLEGELGGIMR